MNQNKNPNILKIKTMNPLIAGIINSIPAIVNTAGSLLKNKKNKDEKTSLLLPSFAPDIHNIANGLELSSKTVIGYGLGGYIIYYALSHEPVNLYILGIGAAVAIATTIAKVFEK